MESQNFFTQEDYCRNTEFSFISIIQVSRRPNDEPNLCVVMTSDPLFIPKFIGLFLDSELDFTIIDSSYQSIEDPFPIKITKTTMEHDINKNNKWGYCIFLNKNDLLSGYIYTNEWVLVESLGYVLSEGWQYIQYRRNLSGVFEKITEGKK